jgi:hypothetical protein
MSLLLAAADEQQQLVAAATEQRETAAASALQVWFCMCVALQASGFKGLWVWAHAMADMMSAQQMHV